MVREKASMPPAGLGRVAVMSARSDGRTSPARRRPCTVPAGESIVRPSRASTPSRHVAAVEKRSTVTGCCCRCRYLSLSTCSSSIRASHLARERETVGQAMLGGSLLGGELSKTSTPARDNSFTSRRPLNSPWGSHRRRRRSMVTRFSGIDNRMPLSRRSRASEPSTSRVSIVRGVNLETRSRTVRAPEGVPASQATVATAASAAMPRMSRKRIRSLPRGVTAGTPP